MTNIALPIWLIILMVGAPSLCLLGLAIRMTRQRRLKQDGDLDQFTRPFAPPPMMESSFQHNLHALQIDAVFNALSALVETERIKLKSLLCPTLLQVSRSTVEECELPFETEKPPCKPSKGIRHEIAAKVAAGESCAAIANALGISHSEVELAISIAGELDEDQQPRLEAVA